MGDEYLGSNGQGDHWDARAELVVRSNDVLGEAPLWLSLRDELAWLDIDAGLVHRFSPTTGEESFHCVGAPVGLCVPMADERLLLGRGLDLVALDLDDGSENWVASVPADPREFRLNDGKCDEEGRLWAGTLNRVDEEAGQASLYCITGRKSTSEVLNDVGLSNGIDWSPDGSLLYFVDSLSGGVDVFDFDVEDGSLSNRIRFADIDSNAGIPDGLTVDSHGNVWVAVWGGGMVICFDTLGNQVEQIEVPVAQTTCCAFGGEGLVDLYVTTASVGLSPYEQESQPLAGSLFRIPGLGPGKPPNSFVDTAPSERFAK